MSEFIITSDQLERLIEGIEHDTGREISRVVARGTELLEVVRCRDCKHGHITIDGKCCKWCDLLATHDPDGDGDPPNGYDPEPYFDADFFCAWGELGIEVD